MVGILLALPAVAACGGEGASSGSDGPASRAGPDTASPLPDRQLGELRRERLTLGLPWTTERVDREPTDAADTAAIRAVRVARVDGLDRIVLEFDSAAAVPGYVARTTLAPVPVCGTGDSVRAEGAGLLALELRNARLSGAIEEAGAPEPDDLYNVRGLHIACARPGAVHWVLDVRNATSYRVLEAADPPRLVVDVRH